MFVQGTAQEAERGCDTLVATGTATADGSTLFAKNSDRDQAECQPLVWIPGVEHPPGATLRCTYVEIPQAPRTYTVIGSQPYWLWGFEHGMNEHQVAIGNEAIWTKAPRQATGLLGMDLLRLGLERGRTAYEAMHVIIALLERYGQGGCPRANGTGEPYDNSFIIADPREAWVLETAGRRWVARRVRNGIYSISNVPTIEEEWDEAAPHLIDHAVAHGWWQAKDPQPFNFTRAYADLVHYPRVGAQPRCARSRWLLGQRRGHLTAQDMMGFLRDHYDETFLAPRRGPDDPDLPTICMHARNGESWQTAASVVAQLRKRGTATYWGSFVTPCTACFLPYYVTAPLPEKLARGGAEPDAGSPWWRFHALSARLRGRWQEGYPVVRATWQELEQQILASAPMVEQKAAGLRVAGRPDDARQALAGFMHGNVEAMLARLSDLGSPAASSTL